MHNSGYGTRKLTVRRLHGSACLSTWHIMLRVSDNPHILTDAQFACINGRCPQCGGQFARSAPVRCTSCSVDDLTRDRTIGHVD